MGGQSGQAGMGWLPYALMTVVAWGVYGIFLKYGNGSMGDRSNGVFKAFLFVGIAYFLTAVIAPIFVLHLRGVEWWKLSSFTASGSGLSLVAGIVGAIGAFCVLLAFDAHGMPSVVMAIIFAGAPIVNAVVATAISPPEAGWGSIRWPFYAGILLAAIGGGLVTRYAPAAPPSHGAPAPTKTAESTKPVSTRT